MFNTIQMVDEFAKKQAAKLFYIQVWYMILANLGVNPPRFELLNWLRRYETEQDWQL